MRHNHCVGRRVTPPSHSLQAEIKPVDKLRRITVLFVDHDLPNIGRYLVVEHTDEQRAGGHQEARVLNAY